MLFSLFYGNQIAFQPKSFTIVLFYLGRKNGIFFIKTLLVKLHARNQIPILEFDLVLVGCCLLFLKDAKLPVNKWLY
jgi:hypothetical protein